MHYRVGYRSLLVSGRRGVDESCVLGEGSEGRWKGGVGGEVKEEGVFREKRVRLRLPEGVRESRGGEEGEEGWEGKRAEDGGAHVEEGRERVKEGRKETSSSRKGSSRSWDFFSFLQSERSR